MPMKAARRAGIAAIRHAKTISNDSGKTEDQEAIDKMEISARNAMADTADTALNAKDSLASQIKKKRPDIKNTRDIKTGTRSIKKADHSIKSAAEATRMAQKSATTAAKQAAVTSQKVASARKAERLAKKTAEWVKKIVKGIIEGLKRLGAALGSASVPILLILVLAGLIAGIVASAFGIFFAGDQSGESTRTLQEVVLEINGEYTGLIEQIKTDTPHDELVMEGYQASWPEVLSVYAVYVTTNSEGATDVVHLTDDNVEVLRYIFWSMNSVTYTTEVIEETTLVPDLDEDGNQKTDADGNLLYVEETTSKTVLHITISHLSAADEAAILGFNDEQLAELNELLDVKYASLWAQVLRGVGLGSNELVNLALSQLGNEGGEKFWRWAGLDSRCEAVKNAFLMEKGYQNLAKITSQDEIDGYDDFVFINRFGHVQHQGTLNKAIRRIVRDYNLEAVEAGITDPEEMLPHFSCHVLRHTFATRMMESGVGLKYLSSQLGHSEIQTTLDIYVTTTDEFGQRENKSFEDYMKSSLLSLVKKDGPDVQQLVSWLTLAHTDYL